MLKLTDFQPTFPEIVIEDDVRERNVSRQESFETMHGMLNAMHEADLGYDGSLKSASGMAGAVNAITSSEMSLAGARSAIAPDEVIDSMRRIGKLIPECLRETSREGLAVTASALSMINNKL